MASVPTIRLNNGVEIPQLGFGVFQVKPEETVEAVTQRRSRSATGTSTPRRCTATRRRSARRSASPGIDRSEVFVTSKLNNNQHAPRRRPEAFDQTLADLGFDYLDLFLIHWPLPGIDVDYVETLEGDGGDLRGGRCRAIGVSNFHQHHLRRLFEATEIRAGGQPDRGQPLPDPGPAAGVQHASTRSHVEAWSPIARGKVSDDPAISRSPSRSARRRRRSRCAGTCSAATSSSRSRSSASRMEENFAHLRLRARRVGHGGDHRAGPRRAHRPEPGRVQLHPR